MYNITLRHIRATITAVEKATSITYSECVFVVLGIQHAMRMRHTVICGLSGSTIFLHIISLMAWLKKNNKKKIYIYIYRTQNVCFDFLYKFCLQHFSFWEGISKIWSQMYVGLHLRYHSFWSYFNETRIFWTDFRRLLKPWVSRKSVQWEPSRRVQTDGQTWWS